MGQRWNYSSKTLTTSNTLNYVRSFDKHNLTAMVGYEAEKRNLMTLTASSHNYSTHKLPELSNGQANSNASYTNCATMMSWLGSVNYNYATSITCLLAIVVTVLHVSTKITVGVTSTP